MNNIVKTSDIINFYVNLEVFWKFWNCWIFLVFGLGFDGGSSLVPTTVRSDNCLDAATISFLEKYSTTETNFLGSAETETTKSPKPKPKPNRNHVA